MIKLTSLLPIVTLKPIGYTSNNPWLHEAGGQPVDPTKQGKENGGDEQVPPQQNQPAKQAPPQPQQNGEVSPEQQDIDSTIDSTSAETSAVTPDPSALDSNTGMAFLLSKLVGKAKADNTIDALAASFVDQLKITDFAKFKEDTKKYSNVDGMAELTNSIANMIDHSKEKVNESEYPWKSFIQRFL